MGFIIGLLTFAMVLLCGILILLVLIQLPRKEASAGLAFGGTATDALFGAGSGNRFDQNHEICCHRLFRPGAVAFDSPEPLSFREQRWLSACARARRGFDVALTKTLERTAAALLRFGRAEKRQGGSCRRTPTPGGCRSVSR